MQCEMNHGLCDLNNDVLDKCISFLSLKEKYFYSVYLISKSINQILHKHIVDEIYNNPIYKKILCKEQIKHELSIIDDLKLAPIVFFELKFFQNNFRDFKNYMFHFCRKIKTNCFFLATRLQKVYFVQKLGDNCCLLLFHHQESIYYNVFYSKIPFRDEDSLTKHQSGYIYFNGELIDEHKDIIDIILERHEKGSYN